jgi:hypothetical protein
LHRRSARRAEASTSLSRARFSAGGRGVFESLGTGAAHALVGVGEAVCQALPNQRIVIVGGFVLPPTRQLVERGESHIGIVVVGQAEQSVSGGGAQPRPGAGRKRAREPVAQVRIGVGDERGEDLDRLRETSKT